MALIDASELRARFDIDTTGFDDERLDPHIASASRRLLRWVGQTNYDDVSLKPLLQNAEAHLAMHYAILGFNSPITAKGVMATATSSEDREVRRYLSPKETAELAQQFLDLAQEMVSDLLSPAATPEAPFETIGSTDCTIDTSCEAVTRSCNG